MPFERNGHIICSTHVSVDRQLLALICVPASACAAAGEISGSVYDQTGASLPGAA
jgi:hypothetical protein